MWAAALLAAVTAGAMAIAGDDWLRTGIFDMLPPGEYDPELVAAADAVRDAASRRLIVAVGHGDRTEASSAARIAVTALGAVDGVAVEAAPDVDALHAYALGNLPVLLSQRQIASIEADGGARVAREALAGYYGAAGIGASADLEADPFHLLTDALSSRAPPGVLAVEDGMLVADRDGMRWVVIRARVADAGTIERQRTLADGVARMRAEVTAAVPGATVAATGFVLYSDEGARSARRDIARIGTGSVIGVFLLLTVAFRSVRPLALALASIGTGLAFAFAATLAVFGSVHLLALAVGASLIGVATDYTLHFVTEEAYGDAGGADAVLERIGAGLVFACATSALAYAALATTRFPVLQQTAVFSAAGLVGACLTVFGGFRLWRPARTAAPPRSTVRWANLYADRIAAISAPVRAAIVGAAVVAGVVATPFVEFDDDIRILQARSTALDEDAALVRRILGEQPDAYIMVRGSNPDQVLAREEALTRTLEAAGVDRYLAVSSWVPSSGRARVSADAYRELTANHLESLAAGIGWESTPDASRARPIPTVDAWLAGPAADGLRDLWLGRRGDDFYSAVAVQSGLPGGVRAHIAADPHLAHIDHREALSESFRSFRVRAAMVLAGVGVLVFAWFTWFLGVRRAAAVVATPAGAALLALVAVGASGSALTLFHVVALFIVFGVGIDYALFLALSRGARSTTMTAVTLAAGTTVLSFGLLAMSGTYAIAGFGITLAVGIVLCYLLAPLAVVRT